MTHPARTVSNWGRWGAADERGCFNLITDQSIKRAAGLIKNGKTYSLAAPLDAGGPQWPPRPKVWQVTTFRNPPGGLGNAGDAIMMHSHCGTHIDGLCHMWYEDRLFNGFSAAEHITSAGAGRNGIDKIPYIVGRAVLLDIAGWKRVEHLSLGEAVTASDLEELAADKAYKSFLVIAPLRLTGATGSPINPIAIT